MPRLVVAAALAVMLVFAVVAVRDDRYGFAAGFVVVAVGFKGDTLPAIYRLGHAEAAS